MVTHQSSPLTFLRSPVIIMTVFVACLVAATASESKPNIVLIMADDLGYSDLGCYGGEIRTPNLDRLAKKGLQFTQFYNCGKCAPTRSALLTGQNPQMVGEFGPPAGRQWPASVTLAELLKAQGYGTYMAGKWHGKRDQGIPVKRGFDRFYGFVRGSHGYFNQKGMRLDDRKAPSDDDFYLTDTLTDYAIDFLKENKKTGKPFFLYVAHHAPHFPLEARKDDIEKYTTVYSAGWDAIRKERFRRQKELGLVAKDAVLPPRDPDEKAWKDASKKERGQLNMAIYAAMVDRMDQNIGRLLAEVESQGALENTLILFLSDNGASDEYYEKFRVQTKPWANVSNTPYREYKRWTHEGGIRTPFLVHWPKGIKNPGTLCHQPGHVVDIMSTFVDITKAEYPATNRGEAVRPREGSSLLPIFQGNEREGHDALYFYFQGSAAVIKSNWKLVAYGNGRPWKSEKQPVWELYNLDNDIGELRDLSSEEPERAKAMSDMYDAWAARWIDHCTMPDPRPRLRE